MFKTLGEGLSAVLTTADPAEKATCARTVYHRWQQGKLQADFNAKAPDRPARPDAPILLLPADMPKRRKAGNLENRIALLHAICHIELNAIDLAADITLRFGHDMPDAFIADWLKVMDDEARHFGLLSSRLAELGSYYGALPAHDGLWQSAQKTQHDLLARLSIVPLVLEARGLDVTPQMIRRMEKIGDNQSAAALKTIYEEEKDHVAAGTRWFRYLADKTGENHELLFHKLVRKYFNGPLKPPFNVPARDAADFPEDWYAPLANYL